MTPENEPVSCRPDPDQMSAFQKNYGLWIFATVKGEKRKPGSFPSAPKKSYEFYSITQLYEGAGKFQISGRSEQDVRPGDCLILTPGVIHRCGGRDGKAWCADTIHFTGPIADVLARSGILKSGLVSAGPTRRLLPILEAASDSSPDSQLRAGIELQRLLLDLHRHSRRPEEKRDFAVLEDLLQQLEEHLDQWWTVERMAEYCNLSCGRLRRLFLQYTGKTPKRYLDSLKLRHAGKMLSDSNRKISEIASLLGYVDAYHFARRFKAVMGIAPGRYRQRS